jgi:DNA mismatch repair protein MutL
MPIIKQLDPITITKIAAGEVIDRPSSIVKELIENAIDASASKIRIDIEDGGKQRIRITDNGIGMSKEDLPLAPMRHTTSKINALEDLYDTHTFGFRGEALASICHVSQLTIVSHHEGDDAYMVTANEDKISDILPTTHPIGTTIDVKDLFFNVPVRRKFLRSSSTERSYITEIVIQFILSNPSIDFIFTSDRKEVLNSSGIYSQHDLLILLFGKSLRGNLVEINQTVGPVTFSGFVSSPVLTFSNRSKQIVSVNGRLVKSAVIQKSLTQSFKDLIPNRRFPLVLLHIGVSNQTLDVNIHPQKSDIKFVNPGFLYDALPKAISLSFQSTPPDISSLQNIDTPKEIVSDHAFSEKSFSGNLNQKVVPISPAYSSAASSFLSPTSHDSPVSEQPSLDFLYSTEKKSHSHTYFQLFNTYIVIPTDAGMYILDQHAVHERILYEKIKDTYAKQSSRQVLLISEVIEVSPDLFQIFEEKCDYFHSLNFLVESFGANKIIIRELPVPFSEVNAKELVLDILYQLQSFPNSHRDITLDQKESLQLRACKAAIKAGKKLFPEEINALVDDLISCPSNYTCPHGRPLSLFFDKNKLERLFLRS